MRLQGKKAVVTGAAAGIGKAIATAFAQEGAEVALLDLHLDKATAVAAEIAKACGAKTCAVQCDVGYADQVAKAFQEVDRQLGGLDILVNNAGLIRQSPIVEMSEEDWGLHPPQQSQERVPLLEGRRPADDRSAPGRADHRHLQHPRRVERTELRALHGGQGRHRGILPHPGHRNGAA